MKTYTITCQASVLVPDDAEEVSAVDGRVVGFQLKDGTQISPWITWEHHDTKTDKYTDLTQEGLEALGFEGFEHGERELQEETF